MRPPDPPCARCGQVHITRYGYAACTGHKDQPDGTLKPCTQPPRQGQAVCGYHGGKAAQNLAAAADRLEEERATRELVRLGQPRAIDPGAALLELVHWTAGEVEFWRAKVVELADGDEHDLTWGRKSKVRKTSGQFPGTDTTFAAGEPVEYRLMVDASNRLADYAARALKAGIQERQVRLAEQQGQIVVGLLQRILDGLYAALIAAGIPDETLAEAWRAAVASVVPTVLRAAALEGSLT